MEDYDTNYLKAEKDYSLNLTCPDFINDTVKILQEKGVSPVCSILQPSTCNTELPRLKFYSLPISVRTRAESCHGLEMPTEATSNLTKEETDFPLAFSILAHG